MSVGPPNLRCSSSGRDKFAYKFNASSTRSSALRTTSTRLSLSVEKQPCIDPQLCRLAREKSSNDLAESER